MKKASRQRAPSTLAVAPAPLLGRWTWVRELGRGGSGRVVLAREPDGGEVALKMVPARGGARLAWEMRALGRVSHPNVAAALALVRLEQSAPAPWGLAVGTTILAESFARGEAADSMLARMRGRPQAIVELTAHVVGQIAEGLAAVHAAGLVHGDVKPANVIVERERERTTAVLVDLGLARAPGIGTAAGTPAYMAPEAFGGVASVATDLFSLGATAFELLTGALPHGLSRGASVARLAHASLALRSLGPGDLPGWVPPSLLRVVCECLRRDPSERPASVEWVADTLAPLRGIAASAALRRASPEAEAARIERLPWVGPLGARERLVSFLEDAIDARGPLAIDVIGPHGSGRARLVVDAVHELQASRVIRGAYCPPFSHGAGPWLDEPGIVLLEDEPEALVVAARVRAEARARYLAERRTVLVTIRTTASEANADVRSVSVGPLESSDIARLLECAMGRKPSPALLDAALEASAGLAGVLVRTLAEAARRSKPLDRASSLVAARRLPVDDLVGNARRIASILAAAGGTLPYGTVGVLFAEDAAALDEGAHELRRAGKAMLDGDGRLVLRADVVSWLRETEEARRAASVLLAIHPNESFALAHASMLVRSPDAWTHVRAALDALRRRGELDRAIELLRTFAGSSTGTVRAEAATRLAEALRAAAQYERALAALDGVESDRALVLRADVLRRMGRGREARVITRRLLAAGAAGAEGASGVAGVPDAAHAVAARLLVTRADGASGATDAARAIAARLLLDEGRLEEAMEVIGDEASDEPVRVREVRALIELARGDAASARRLLDVGHAGVSQEDEARLLSVSASAAIVQGDAVSAVAALERAVELAESAAEPHAAAVYLASLASVRAESGELALALDDLRRAAKVLLRLGRASELSRCLYNLANVLAVVGHDADALDALGGAIRAADDAGDSEVRGHLALLEGELALRRGDLGRALAVWREVASASRTSPRLRVLLGARIAEAESARGAVEQANEAIAAARRTLATLGDDAAAIDVDIAAARVAAEASPPDLERARACALAAWERASRGAAFETRLRAAVSAATTLEVAGEPARAAEIRAAGRALLDRMAAALPVAMRGKLRAVPGYQGLLARAPSARGADGADGGPDARWRALAVAAAALVSETRRVRVAERLVELALDLLGAERAFVMVRDLDGRPRVLAARGLAPLADDEAPSRSVALRVLAEGTPMSSVDARVDARLEGAASVHSMHLRSVLAAPLVAAGRGREQSPHAGRVLGVLYADDRLRVGAFGSTEEALLRALAAMGAGAFEASRTLASTRREARRVESLRRRLAKTVDAQAAELVALRRARGSDALVGELRGASPAARKLSDLVALVARGDPPVLVVGESGTGKELVARAIHALGPRAAGPFVAESCAAIPEALFEATLFGHVRGAFTGADRARIGLFEAAHGGTLLLDEIGEMPIPMQAKLLRALEQREVRPVGATRTRSIDVRVVAATHRDLHAMVERGTFRQDLLYRLAVLTIPVPPLRDRADDVPLLVAHLLDRHAAGRRPRVERRAMAALSRFAWPGNVRQLENEVRRWCAAGVEVVRVEDLSPEIGAPVASSDDALDLRSRTDALERELIGRALERAGNNRTKAAALLGVSRFGLQKMLARLRM